MKRNILIWLLILFVSNAIAQPPSYTSHNQKAIRAYESASHYYDARQDDKAISTLKDALQLDSAFVECYLLLANIYTDHNDAQHTKENYRKAVTVNPDFFPKALLTLSRMEFKSEEYAEAKIHSEKFLTYDKMDASQVDQAKQIKANCDFAIEAIKHPVPFDPVNLGDSINTSDDEYFPAITADGKTFLFTRKLKTFRYNKPSYQEDFFTSNFIKDHWTNAKPIPEINTSGNEGAPALSADGQYLFFIACKEFEGYPGGRKGQGSCDIFISKKIGSKWGEPRNLETPVNTDSWESQPSFSSDGRTLYFVRATRNADGKTDRDIYSTHIDDNSQWSKPEALPPNINTSGDEQSVFIHPDDQTLYFSSDGHPGMGGLDIFMSKRQQDGTWGYPVNLGYPINTSGDENSLLVAPTGDVAYFASDRAGGKGRQDIYQFALTEKAKPEKIVYLKGVVTDAETRNFLSASFELIDLATGKTVVRSSSNAGNGEFLVVLPAGKNYALNVSKQGYLFYSEHFELKNPADASAPVNKDIAMKPIKAGEKVVLKNIFYETNKYNLKDESKAELGKIISFMKENPKVKMEVSGHTDDVGGKEYNQTLSEKRAKAVYDYLITAGASPERLSSKGYGMNMPVEKNDSDEHRAMNRRTEFKVIAVN